MKVTVNGKPHELPEEAGLAEAAAAIGVDSGTRGLAFAVDGEVVPREEISRRRLSEGQRVEIVAAIQGG